jgi:hypothetical protein
VTFIIKWRCPDTGRPYRVHAPLHEGRRFVTREEAETMRRKFQGNDRASDYWVEELREQDG